MRRVLIGAFAFVLAAALASRAAAESHTFRLMSEARLNGTQLESGRYKVKLNGEEAEIYRGGKLIVTAKVEVRPLEEGRLANTNKIERGELREIRLKKEVIAFLPES